MLELESNLLFVIMGGLFLCGMAALLGDVWIGFA